ncbi:hypothetical protein NX068_16990 [Thauera sp. Sel9]|nr:hypothetical protein [Thauera sp. Sel9]
MFFHASMMGREAYRALGGQDIEGEVDTAIFELTRRAGPANRRKTPVPPPNSLNAKTGAAKRGAPAARPPIPRMPPHETPRVGMI